MYSPEATSAAGVYVGMTRGRQTNRLRIVAAEMADARARFIEAMERDPADGGLEHAIAQAAEAVRGLGSDGPVRQVVEELAQLDQEAERAEQAAERWEQIATRLDAQRAAHRAEDDENTTALRQAEKAAEQVRAKVTRPLVAQAEHDGTAYLAAVEVETAASARLATVGRFGRRKARTEHRTAIEQARTVRGHIRDAWGDEPPRAPAALPEWAVQVAARQAENDPRISDADRAVETTRAARKATQQRHQQARTALLVKKYGADQARRDQLGMRTVNPHREAQDSRRRAAATRAEADELRKLPVNEAASLIEATRAEQERLRQQMAERARRLGDRYEHEPHRHNPDRWRPTRGL